MTYPGLDYSAFPRTADEWFAGVCATDTGNIDCVPVWLRPYVDPDLLTPEGWFRVPAHSFPTPLRHALWQLCFDTKADFPWKGLGVSPATAREWWEEYKAEQAKVPEPFKPEPTVDLYFIAADDGPIKIGISGDPAQRLRTLQTGYPHPLRLLAVVVGAAEQEPRYHERFAEHRLAGEWFERHPDILAEIERLSPQKSRVER